MLRKQDEKCEDFLLNQISWREICLGERRETEKELREMESTEKKKIVGIYVWYIYIISFSSKKAIKIELQFCHTEKLMEITNKS